MKPFNSVDTSTKDLQSLLKANETPRQAQNTNNESNKDQLTFSTNKYGSSKTLNSPFSPPNPEHTSHF